MLFRCAIGVVFFTNLAEFFRMLVGIPVTWGTVALDAGVVTLPITVALWFQAKLPSTDSFASDAAMPTPPMPVSAAIEFESSAGQER